MNFGICQSWFQFRLRHQLVHDFGQPFNLSLYFLMKKKKLIKASSKSFSNNYSLPYCISQKNQTNNNNNTTTMLLLYMEGRQPTRKRQPQFYMQAIVSQKCHGTLEAECCGGWGSIAKVGKNPSHQSEVRSRPGSATYQLCLLKQITLPLKACFLFCKLRTILHRL